MTSAPNLTRPHDPYIVNTALELSRLKALDFYFLTCPAVTCDTRALYLEWFRSPALNTEHIMKGRESKDIMWTCLQTLCCLDSRLEIINSALPFLCRCV